MASYRFTPSGVDELRTRAGAPARAIWNDDFHGWGNSPETTEDANGTRRLAPPKLFVMDDDLLFCRLMEKLANRNGVPIVVCSSLDDLERKADEDYDVAILDYYVEDLKGTQLVNRLHERPVVLVSRSENCLHEGGRWPACIKRFVAKREGIQAILDAALTVGRE